MKSPMRPAILSAMLAAIGLFAGAATLRAESLDEAVTNVKVRGILLEHFGTDALGIKIQVNGGNVVLAGRVEKGNTQELAKQAALSVKGVTSVDNRIELGKGPASKANESTARAKVKLDDALLEAKVKGRLFDQVGGNALKIGVDAERGSVTLRGAVPTKEILKTALDTVKKTSGVRRVRNMLTVG